MSKYAESVDISCRNIRKIMMISDVEYTENDDIGCRNMQKVMISFVEVSRNYGIGVEISRKC